MDISTAVFETCYHCELLSTIEVALERIREELGEGKQSSEFTEGKEVLVN